MVSRAAVAGGVFMVGEGQGFWANTFSTGHQQAEKVAAPHTMQNKGQIEHKDGLMKKPCESGLFAPTCECEPQDPY